VISFTYLCLSFRLIYS